MKTPRALDFENINRIMIRTNNWIGDAVMNTPAMGVLRDAFPHAEIVVIANPIIGELFRFHPYCDRVTIYDGKGEHKGILGMTRFSAQLRRECFDLAILFQKAIEAAIMASLARVPRRMGYSTDGRGLLLTHRIPFEVVPGQHESLNYVNLLQQFGITGGDGKQRLVCTSEEKKRARDILESGTFMALNPGAAYGSAKRWIPERFAEVGDRLSAMYGVRMVLTGGPGEIEIGRDIEAAMASSPLNLIGQTSIREMMAILSECQLVVTNDSGPMHVAAALGVPTVAIFGPTDHTSTYPLVEHRRIVRHPVDCSPCKLRTCPTDHRCMNGVTAEDVIRAAEELMAQIEERFQK